MNDAKEVLKHIGYTEVRDRREEGWKPMEAVNGRYGTTDDTHLIVPQEEHQPDDGTKICLLIEEETGERVGTARMNG